MEKTFLKQKLKCWHRVLPVHDWRNIGIKNICEIKIQKKATQIFLIFTTLIHYKYTSKKGLIMEDTRYIIFKISFLDSNSDEILKKYLGIVICEGIF